MDVFNRTGLRAAWLIGNVPPHRLSATLIVKGTFRLRAGSPCEAVPSEDQQELTGDVHVDEDFGMPLLYPSDFVPAKPLADLVLNGTCHTPGRAPLPYCRVEFHVGSWSKFLAVVGDRTWNGGPLSRGMTEPVPFQRMPLTYERSFGGADFAPNPLGRGFKEEPLPDGRRAWRLPNVESIDHLIRHQDNRPEPAGFGPLPMTWPQRMSKAGTYDRAWLEERWPLLPKDADWSLFNAAPSDQQIRGFLRGDERLLFVNLHGTHHRYESALPGVRVRWFVDDEVGGRMRFREVQLRLDTLFADLDAERLVLVWRGVVDIRSKKLKEVGAHLLVTEPLASPPQPSDRYLEELQRLQARAVAPAERVIRSIEWPEPTPPPSTAWVKEAEAEVERMEADMMSMLQAQQTRLTEFHAALAASGEKVPKASPAIPGSSDFFGLAAAAHQRLLERHPEAKSLFPAPRKEDLAFTPPGMPTVPELAGIRAASEEWTRERVLERVAASAGFEGEDLSGLDLSGCDLSGADFTGAVLAEATLVGARLAGARMVKTILTKVDLTAADLTGTILTDADLSGARLEEARLRDAQLQDADLSGAILPAVDLAGVDARGALFLDANLEGAIFRGAVLALAEFDGAAGASADFTRADLTSASLTGFQAPQALFVEAILIKTAGAGGDFTGAKYSHCSARESIWEGAQLDGAYFLGADVSSANFEAASLRKACFVDCLARRGRFPEANLEQADFTGADLFRATFEGASLHGTRFDGCNLYESEFFEAQIRDSSFGLANLKGTKLA